MPWARGLWPTPPAFSAQTPPCSGGGGHNSTDPPFTGGGATVIPTPPHLPMVALATPPVGGTVLDAVSVAFARASWSSGSSLDGPASSNK